MSDVKVISIGDEIMVKGTSNNDKKESKTLKEKITCLLKNFNSINLVELEELISKELSSRVNMQIRLHSEFVNAGNVNEVILTRFINSITDLRLILSTRLRASLLLLLMVNKKDEIIKDLENDIIDITVISEILGSDNVSDEVKKEVYMYAGIKDVIANNRYVFISLTDIDIDSLKNYGVYADELSYNELCALSNREDFPNILISRIKNDLEKKSEEDIINDISQVYFNCIPSHVTNNLLLELIRDTELSNDIKISMIYKFIPMTENILKVIKYEEIHALMKIFGEVKLFDLLHFIFTKKKSIAPEDIIFAEGIFDKFVELYYNDERIMSKIIPYVKIDKLQIFVSYADGIKKRLKDPDTSINDEITKYMRYLLLNKDFRSEFINNTTIIQDIKDYWSIQLKNLKAYIELISVLSKYCDCQTQFEIARTVINHIYDRYILVVFRDILSEILKSVPNANYALMELDLTRLIASSISDYPDQLLNILNHLDRNTIIYKYGDLIKFRLTSLNKNNNVELFTEKGHAKLFAFVDNDADIDKGYKKYFIKTIYSLDLRKEPSKAKVLTALNRTLKAKRKGLYICVSLNSNVQLIDYVKKFDKAAICRTIEIISKITDDNDSESIIFFIESIKETVVYHDLRLEIELHPDIMKKVVHQDYKILDEKISFINSMTGEEYSHNIIRESYKDIADFISDIDYNIELEDMLHIINKVDDMKDVHISKKIGSRNSNTYYFLKHDIVKCGCFVGRLKDFEETVEMQYGFKEEKPKEYEPEPVPIIGRGGSRPFIFRGATVADPDIVDIDMNTELPEIQHSMNVQSVAEGLYRISLNSTYGASGIADSSFNFADRILKSPVYKSISKEIIEDEDEDVTRYDEEEYDLMKSEKDKINKEKYYKEYMEFIAECKSLKQM